MSFTLTPGNRILIIVKSGLWMSRFTDGLPDLQIFVYLIGFPAAAGFASLLLIRKGQKGMCSSSSCEWNLCLQHGENPLQEQKMSSHRAMLNTNRNATSRECNSRNPWIPLHIHWFHCMDRQRATCEIGMITEHQWLVHSLYGQKYWDTPFFRREKGTSKLWQQRNSCT